MIRLCTLLPLIAALHSTLQAQTPPNVRVHLASNLVQNEEQVWISATDPLSVVADWRDFRLGYRRIGVGVSTDGGMTWSDSLVVGQHAWQSDPAMVGDQAGNYFMTMLDYNPDTRGQDSSQISVWRSTDGGTTWTGPVAVAPLGPHFEDKVLTAVDRTGGSFDGNLYVAWQRAPASDGPSIMFARSTDGAQSFDEPVTVGPTVFTPNCGESRPYNFATPVVNADGSVHVFWIGEHVDSATCHAEWAVRHAYSLDGGSTFAKDSVAFLTDRLYSSVDGHITVWEAPSCDADLSGGPYHGTLYLAQCQYTETEGAYDLDIEVRKSTDNGASWSDPAPANDDHPGLDIDQFHPWLTVSDDGVVIIVFYDQRNDPVNHRLFDCFCAVSFDGAETFATNYRLSSVSSNPDNLVASAKPLAGPFLGTPFCSHSPYSASVAAGTLAEYIGVHSRGDDVVALWTDLREGNQDVYSAQFVLPFMSPRLYSPPHGASVSSSDLAFRWSTCWHETADSYRLEVASDSTFSELVALIQDIPDNELSFGSQLAAGEYWWRVKAFRLGGDSTAYSAASGLITCTQAGTPPVLVSPVLGDTVVGPATTLEWDTVTGALQYRVQVSLESDFSLLLVDDSLVGNTYPVSGLTGDWTVCYWRVNSTNPCGTGAWSESQFEVCQPPAAPSILAPPPMDTIADSSITLQWSIDSSAFEYRLVLSTSDTYSPAILDTTVSMASFMVSDLDRVTYYWRVNATKICGTGQWSESWFSRCPIEQAGDMNMDTVITSADIIYLVNYVFKSGPPPQPISTAGDVSCDSAVTSVDVICLVNFVFKSGGSPCDICEFLFGS